MKIFKAVLILFFTYSLPINVFMFAVMHFSKINNTDFYPSVVYFFVIFTAFFGIKRYCDYKYSMILIFPYLKVLISSFIYLMLYIIANFSYNISSQPITASKHYFFILFLLCLIFLFSPHYMIINRSGTIVSFKESIKLSAKNIGVSLLSVLPSLLISFIGVIIYRSINYIYFQFILKVITISFCIVFYIIFTTEIFLKIANVSRPQR